MMRIAIRPIALMAAVVVLLVLMPVTSAEVVLPIRMRAFAVNMSNNLTGANGILEITVDKWSTEADRTKLLEKLPKGQDDMLKELKKLPITGRVRIPGWMGPDPQQYRLGWNIRYAWHEALEDGQGERIVLATDRYMSFRELANNPRTTDYPFLLMQIHLDKEGTKGQGKMAPFAQISFDKKKNSMVIENYGTEPVRLNEI